LRKPNSKRRLIGGKFDLNSFGKTYGEGESKLKRLQVREGMEKTRGGKREMGNKAW